MHWTAALARKTQLPPNARIVADVICIHCGHNLRGIRALGVCGECGKPAEESLSIFPKPGRVVGPLRGMAMTCWISAAGLALITALLWFSSSCAFILLVAIPLLATWRMVEMIELRFASMLQNRGSIGQRIRHAFGIACIDAGLSLVPLVGAFGVQAGWFTGPPQGMFEILLGCWVLVVIGTTIVVSRVAGAIADAIGYEGIVRECRWQALWGVSVIVITAMAFYGEPVLAAILRNPDHVYAATVVIMLTVPVLWIVHFVLTAVVLTHTANAVEMETEIDEDVLSSDPEVTGVPERRVPDEPPIPLG